LIAWIKVNIFDRGSDVYAETERIDLDAFLRETDRIAIDPAERLRLLAVEIESKACGWGALERVYQRALQRAPNDPWVNASRGISAAFVVHALSLSPDKVARLQREAYRSLTRAVDLDPNDAQISYALGHTVSMDDSIEDTAAQEQALEHFDRALAIDPNHAWARLYRAHCLQDLGRWNEAIEAYDRVPRAAFMGPKSWRIHRLAEQLAWCRLQAGDHDGVLRV
jgi:tetratricopeptide (TPR) repeat protein